MLHDHILIPVALDQEGIVGRKIELARHLLAPGGKITLLTVLEQVPGFVAEFVDLKPENHLTARIRGKLESIADGASDIECDVATGKPGVKIPAYADEKRATLIVVGSHMPGAQDYFLGSTAARVVRRANCSVYVVR